MEVQVVTEGVDVKDFGEGEGESDEAEEKLARSLPTTVEIEMRGLDGGPDALTTVGTPHPEHPATITHDGIGVPMARSTGEQCGRVVGGEGRRMERTKGKRGRGRGKGENRRLRKKKKKKVRSDPKKKEDTRHNTTLGATPRDGGGVGFLFLSTDSLPRVEMTFLSHHHDDSSDRQTPSAPGDRVFTAHAHFIRALLENPLWLSRLTLEGPMVGQPHPTTVRK